MGAQHKAVQTRVNLGHRLVPSLLARDMHKTLAFYENLGFVVTGCFPDKQSPDWIEIKRDSLVLQFYARPPIHSPSDPICSGTFYCFPDSVNALAQEWQHKVTFEWGPEIMEYGMREFGIRDPNGYLLAFSEPADNDTAVR